jgi:hypothetical protein
MATDWLFRRQSPDDKAQQDAFLADIAAHWQPQTLRQRVLHLQSLFVHIVVRLFTGGPTLAPAALAAIPTGIGTLILMFAARPAETQFDPGPPVWDYVLLTAGFFGFAFEALRSPREVRAWRLSLFFAVPTAIGAVVNAATMTMVVLSDQLYRVGMVVLALSATMIAVLPLVAQHARLRVLRVGMRIGGVGAAATVLGDAQWAWLEGVARHAVLGWGCAAAALGAALLATTFLQARPAIA